MYSCYCTPNTGIIAFTNFLQRLERSILATDGPTIVMGDFNAHSPCWGSPREDWRGELLADICTTTNLCVCNVGNEATFVRRASRTHIDVTFTSESIMATIRNCRVLDVESLSLHRYIFYESTNGKVHKTTNIRNGWQVRKLDLRNLKDAIDFKASLDPRPYDTVEEEVEEYSKMLVRIADKCMPRTVFNPKGPYPPPPCTGGLKRFQCCENCVSVAKGHTNGRERREGSRNARRKPRSTN